MENIIYEDKDYIVYNKPAGLLVQSNKSFDTDLVSLLMAYLAKKGERTQLSVINRLDRPVSGLVLLAKNREAASKVSKELVSGEMDKKYFAVVCGRLSRKKGMFTDYLIKDGKNNTSKAVSKEVKGAKKAVLEYEVLAERETDKSLKGVLSLVRIRLMTGRHHQIRVQFASRGHALYGDTKYNPDFKDVKGWVWIALCSYELSFGGRTFTIAPDGEAFAYFRGEAETL